MSRRFPRPPLLSGGNPNPTICRVGEDYYIETSRFSLSPGLPVYHSKDMVNWQMRRRRSWGGRAGTRTASTSVKS
ncbi:MAG: family 43 glycosylhydrolase [Kiritimatiellae bacterium]|nr:family 43 glycosylhydrolase [Kiritimatiellia bacterium]